MNEGPPVLDLPDHGVKLRHGARGGEVFDPLRRKWVALTPEEWVRQHFINHLVHDLGCPPGMVAVEAGLRLYGMPRRTDIVVYGARGEARLLVECKAPSVAITQAVLEQAARYNVVLRAPWSVVTNGRRHLCCTVDHVTGEVNFRDRLPTYAELHPATGH